jgi:hypothetical protein
VERFHRIMRTELLRGRVFADLEDAQTVIDAWVEEYNHRRPHQALGIATPAERFTTTDHSLSGDPPEPTGKLPEGQLVIERRVAEGGIISVAGETFSVGRHLAYRIVTIAVTGRLLHVYVDGPSSRPSDGRPTSPSNRSEPSAPAAQRPKTPQPRSGSTDHQTERINRHLTQQPPLESRDALPCQFGS